MPTCDGNGLGAAEGHGARSLQAFDWRHGLILTAADPGAHTYWQRGRVCRSRAHGHSRSTAVKAAAQTQRETVATRCPPELQTRYLLAYIRP
jgi:hypothetical protein